MIAGNLRKTSVPITDACPFGPWTGVLGEAYLQESIRLAKRRCQSGQQILTVDGLPRVRLFLKRQNSRHGRRLRPRDFAAHGAGSNRHPRIVANALRLAHIAARHHVELVAFFAKPHRSCYLFAALTERGEGIVLGISDIVAASTAKD